MDQNDGIIIILETVGRLISTERTTGGDFKPQEMYRRLQVLSLCFQGLKPLRKKTKYKYGITSCVRHRSRHREFLSEVFQSLSAKT